MLAPRLLEPAAQELIRNYTGNRSATEVARSARDLLGERFDSCSFTYVLMRAFDVEFHAASEAARWHEFDNGPRSLSDDDLEALLRPWLPEA
ncbi:hypothetical protein [Amycolatopsis albispora]|uniref:Uncharacterized protein n=1 Tax=Amycolatopsis albispora TaxID=1804986 RepID=A0A344L865_9PSEU|nr:hypothetical protein [Amycolatopsis albispora]AXB44239.1 hypothetical protein A4R43_18350 [Amycolatopsis albispora]